MDPPCGPPYGPPYGPPIFSYFFPSGLPLFTYKAHVNETNKLTIN